MNPTTITIGPLAAANAALIVANNTPAGAGKLALVGGGAVALDKARKVLVTFGNEAVARRITIKGTSYFGTAINETLAVAAGGAGTVATEQDFLTVTEVDVFAAWSAAMSVGTNTVASSPWIIVDINRLPISIAVGVNVTGVVNYTLEHTYDDPNVGYEAPGVLSIASSNASQSNNPPVVWPDAVMAQKVVTSETRITDPFFAFRVTLNSGAGSIQMQAIQAGISGA